MTYVLRGFILVLRKKFKCEFLCQWPYRHKSFVAQEIFDVPELSECQHDTYNIRCFHVCQWNCVTNLCLVSVLVVCTRHAESPPSTYAARRVASPGATPAALSGSCCG